MQFFSLQERLHVTVHNMKNIIVPWDFWAYCKCWFELYHFECNQDFQPMYNVIEPMPSWSKICAGLDQKEVPNYVALALQGEYCIRVRVDLMRVANWGYEGFDLMHGSQLNSDSFLWYSYLIKISILNH